MAGTRGTLRLGALSTALGLLLCNCDSNPAAPEAWVLLPIAGDDQTAVVGEALPTLLEVEVRDGRSQPVVGADVSWSVTAGIARLENTATFTDVSGRSGNRAILGSTPGLLQISAALSNGSRVAFTAEALPSPYPSVIIIDRPPAPLRRGDVFTFRAVAKDSAGEVLDPSLISWHVAPDSGGFVDSGGRFVGYEIGAVQVVAAAIGAADTIEVEIVARRVNGQYEVVGASSIADRRTTDLWVQGVHAYTGSTGCQQALCGNLLYVWEIAGQPSPRLVDSVLVDATQVNDVMVTSDGKVAALTHEGSDDGLNGVTLLDLSDPGHPQRITRFTEELEGGVHNLWIDGDYLYAAASGLKIIDISTPGSPRLVGSFHAGFSTVHDVYVRDGLAFVSHWNAGLIILDVGAGIAGGSAANPVEISRIDPDGQTHNAWHWQERGYVFVTEEDFGTPGVVHVVDARDLGNLRRVATYRAGSASPPHFFWLDEANEVLHIAYYSEGVRAVDVSGELLGRLDSGGRELASLRYAGDETNSFGIQVHDDLIYVSDRRNGLWVLRFKTASP